MSFIHQAYCLFSTLYAHAVVLKMEYNTAAQRVGDNVAKRITSPGLFMHMSRSLAAGTEKPLVPAPFYCPVLDQPWTQ